MTIVLICYVCKWCTTCLSNL